MNRIIEALEDCMSLLTGEISGQAQHDAILKEAQEALAAYHKAMKEGE